MAGRLAVPADAAPHAAARPPWEAVQDARPEVAAARAVRLEVEAVQDAPSQAEAAPVEQRAAVAPVGPRLRAEAPRAAAGVVRLAAEAAASASPRLEDAVAVRLAWRPAAAARAGDPELRTAPAPPLAAVAVPRV